MSFNFMTTVTVHSDFGGPRKYSLSLFLLFPHSFCHEVMGLDAMALVLWMLNIKPAFPFSSFTFNKRLFHSSLLFAIRVVSSAYLRLFIFLLTSLIPAWASSSLAFGMMNSASKLNKQGDNTQPWHTPFSFWSRLSFHVWFCCLLDLHASFSGDR